MKSPAKVSATIAAAALCGLMPLVAGAASVDQDRPKVKVVQPAPDAPPAVVVEPRFRPRRVSPWYRRRSRARRPRSP